MCIYIWYIIDNALRWATVQVIDGWGYPKTSTWCVGPWPGRLGCMPAVRVTFESPHSGATTGDPQKKNGFIDGLLLGGMTMTLQTPYLYIIYVFYLFICLFIYLLIYLNMYLFKFIHYFFIYTLKISESWTYSTQRYTTCFAIFRRNSCTERCGREDAGVKNLIAS